MVAHSRWGRRETQPGAGNRGAHGKSEHQATECECSVCGNLAFTSKGSHQHLKKWPKVIRDAAYGLLTATYPQSLLFSIHEIGEGFFSSTGDPHNDTVTRPYIERWSRCLAAPLLENPRVGGAVTAGTV